MPDIEALAKALSARPLVQGQPVGNALINQGDSPIMNNFLGLYHALNPFKDATVGDLGEQAAYATPGVGNALSAKDAYDAIGNRDWTGAGLGALGAVPLLGMATGPLKMASKLIPDTRSYLSSIRDLAEQNGGKVYVRWSAGPKYDLQTGARSKDYQTGGYHEGLSANPIESGMSDHDIAKRISEYSYFNSRKSPAQPHLYSGIENGIDSDGTPTIEKLTHLGSVPKDKLRVLDDDDFLAALKAKESADSTRKTLEYYKNNPDKETPPGWLDNLASYLSEHNQTLSEKDTILKSRYGK